MGGDERLRKHRAAGKLDARARIAHLLDPGSFLELGTLVGGEEAPADAIVMGSGRIDGRPVMVAAEDFTVKAGTISAAANAKRYRVAEIAVDRPRSADHDARRRRVPGRRPRSRARRTPTDMLAQARCSGRVPLVTAVLGASAGHGALVAPISDFAVMSRHASIFTAGPPVVLRVDGREDHEGRPRRARRSRSRAGSIHNVRRRRPRRARSRARATCVTSRRRRGRTRRTSRAATTDRVSFPRSSTSFPATAGASTTCAR